MLRFPRDPEPGDEGPFGPGPLVDRLKQLSALVMTFSRSADEWIPTDSWPAHPALVETISGIPRFSFDFGHSLIGELKIVRGDEFYVVRANDEIFVCASATTDIESLLSAVDRVRGPDEYYPFERRPVDDGDAHQHRPQLLDSDRGDLDLAASSFEPREPVVVRHDPASTVSPRGRIDLVLAPNFLIIADEGYICRADGVGGQMIEQSRTVGKVFEKRLAQDFGPGSGSM